MTREETQNLLAYLQAIFQADVKNPKILLNAWADLFKNISYKEATQAAKDFVAQQTNGNYGRFPVPGQIIGIIQRKHAEKMSNVDDAWAQVERAARNGRDYSKTEFNKLPPDIQKAVGSSKMIYSLANSNAYMMDKAKDAFIKRYSEIKEQEAYKQVISGETLQLEDNEQLKLK